MDQSDHVAQSFSQWEIVHLCWLADGRDQSVFSCDDQKWRTELIWSGGGEPYPIRKGELGVIQDVGHVWSIVPCTGAIIPFSYSIHWIPDIGLLAWSENNHFFMVSYNY